MIPMAAENVDDLERESTICEYCGKTFSAKRNLFTHIRNIHGIDPSSGDNTTTVYVCEICGNQLSVKSSLVRHLKIIHGIEQKAREKTFMCPHCSVSYVTKKSLAYHVRLNHSVLASQSDGFSTEENRQDNDEARHLCSYCGKMYSRAYSLKQHVIKVHGVEEHKIPSSACPICDAHVRYGGDFSNHLKSEHDIDEDIEELSFNSMEDFFQWKQKMEKETSSSYSKPTGTKNSQQSLRHFFACHRSGERRTSGKGKRTFNAENIVKIGKLCPSRLIVLESDNGVVVKFHKLHIGHTNCLKYLRLSQSDRELIAGKLQNGITKKQILRDIRSGVPSERIHATNMADIYNIIRDYKLDNDRAHANDSVSLDMWVNQQKLLGPDCPVIHYKKQGEDGANGLDIQDFMVVIMTAYQKMMLSKFTSVKVLMDSTHGTNSYDFQLTTMMVVDEFGAGVPMAFCISNKTDQSAMVRFLLAIKDAMGHSVLCRVFMSDDYPAFYSSWCQVMCVPEHKLLCSWHVIRSWKSNLKKVRCDMKQIEVWQSLMVIIVELDEDIFHQLLEAFLDICSNDPDLQSFHAYFLSKYARSYEMWAFCYRKGLGLNTNMYLEAFHKKLKYCYLDGKVNRRVDRCVAILLRFSKDMMYERFIRLVKGKPTMRMTMISQSHKKSVLVKDEHIERLGEGSWRVQSSKAEFRGPYLVNFDTTTTCDGCPLSCHLCKVCIHQFTCTCMDHLVRGNFCKHIHACLRYARLVDLADDGPIVEEVKAIALFEEMEEMAMTVPTVGEEVGDVIDGKRKVKNLLEICIGATPSVDTGNPHLPRVIRSAERLMTAVHEALRYTEDSNSSHLGAPTTLKKRIECQPRFFSTKKARLAEKQSTKPTDVEILARKNHLLGQ